MDMVAAALGAAAGYVAACVIRVRHRTRSEQRRWEEFQAAMRR